METNFNLERHLLDELHVVFSDTSGKIIPFKFELGTAITNVGINSLSFLEAIQLMCNKYDIRITHEEFAGTTIVGRVERILEAKILERYSNNIEEIKKVALEKELNLVNEKLLRTPGPFAMQ